MSQFWLSSVSLKRVVDKGMCIDVYMYIRNKFWFNFTVFNTLVYWNFPLKQ